MFDATVDPPERVASVSECIGITTNNVAEYKALMPGLEAVAHLHARVIHVRADSLLVIKQLRGRWKVKHENMRPLYAQARSLLAAYDVVDLQHVPRAEHRSRRARQRRAGRVVGGRPMVLWLAFGSIFGVWNVFQSPGLDFRLIALGALLPLVLDAPFGEQAYAHTLLSAVVARRRDGAHDGTRAPAAPAPLPEPGDRLVRRSRARGFLDASEGVLVARVPARPARTQRCWRRGPSS